MTDYFDKNSVLIHLALTSDDAMPDFDSGQDSELMVSLEPSVVKADPLSVEETELIWGLRAFCKRLASGNKVRREEKAFFDSEGVTKSDEAGLKTCKFFKTILIIKTIKRTKNIFSNLNSEDNKIFLTNK